MSVVACDTLRFAQTLRDKANFSPTQAEGLSEAFSQAITGGLATRADLVNLATKDDLAALKADLSALKAATKDDLAALKAATKDDLAALTADMVALRAALKDDLRSLEVKIEASKTDTVRWIVGAVGLQTIVILGAVVALLRFIVH